MSEKLNKSIDQLIDELFEEKVEKADALNLAQDSKTKADEAVNQAPGMQDDDSRGAGRPKQQTTMGDNGSKDYDSATTSPASEQDQPEADQVKEMNQIKDGGRASASGKAPPVAPFKKSLEVSEAEYAEFQAFKKAQEDKQAEELKKAEVQKTEDLIKSVVEKTSAKYESKLEEMSKSLKEQDALIKSLSKTPQRAKSVTNIEALEKSMDPADAPKQEHFTKSEVLDAGMELFKAGKLRDTHVIELENNGFIYDVDARKTLEQYLAKKK